MIEPNDRIITAQTAADKNVSDFTRSDFINHYFSQLPISRSSFDEGKREMRGHLESIGAADALSVLSKVYYDDIRHSGILQGEYFADFASFYDELTKRVQNLSIGSHPSVFDLPVSALIVAWAGVPSEDAVDIRKSWIGEYTRTITDASGKVYHVPPQGIDILSRFAKEHRMIKPNNKGLCEMQLRASPFLFRAFKVDKISKSSLLSNITTKMNTVAGKRFHYNSVRLSGVFSRVLEREGKLGDITPLPRGASVDEKSAFAEEMGRLFEQNFSTETLLIQRLSQYAAWKDYFHGDS